MGNNEKKQIKIERIVKETIAEMLGVETGDINQSDYLIEDLHMGPSEITDLREKLYKQGLLISEIKPQEIETVGELVDYITNNADL